MATPKRKFIDLKSPEVPISTVLYYLHSKLLTEPKYRAAQLILKLFNKEILEFYSARITEDKLIAPNEEDISPDKKFAWRGKFRGVVGPGQYPNIDVAFEVEFNCAAAAGGAGAADTNIEKYKYAQIGLIGRLVRMALHDGTDEEGRLSHFHPIVLLYDAMRSCGSISNDFHNKFSSVFHIIIPEYGHVKNIYTKYKIGSESIKEVPDEGFPGNINTLRHAERSFEEYIEAEKKKVADAAAKASAKAAKASAKAAKANSKSKSKSSDDNNDYPYDSSINCHSFEKLKTDISDDLTVAGWFTPDNIAKIKYNFIILRNIYDSIGQSDTSVIELISEIKAKLKLNTSLSITNILIKDKTTGFNKLNQLENKIKELCASISSAAIEAREAAAAERRSAELAEIIEVMKKKTTEGNKIVTEVKPFDSERNMLQVTFPDKCIKLVKVHKGTPYSLFIMDMVGNIIRNPVAEGGAGGGAGGAGEIVHIYDNFNRITYSIKLCIPGDKPPKSATSTLGKKGKGKPRTRKLFIGGTRRNYRRMTRRKNIV